jgi:8-oxo-dGTP diphosphatase
MTLAGQRLQPDRYQIVPRTLSFLIDGDQVLLLRLSQSRAAWAGKLNGLGGHIERGENPAVSARRELVEETGLTPQDLRLCGVVTIDTQQAIGIGLYVFVGTATGRPQGGGKEGEPIWCDLDGLDPDEVVEDLPALLPRALAVYNQQAAPFCAVYRYGADDRLEIEWAS